jgi:hypothetical protein
MFSVFRRYSSGFTQIYLDLFPVIRDLRSNLTFLSGTQTSTSFGPLESSGAEISSKRVAKGNSSGLGRIPILWFHATAGLLKWMKWLRLHLPIGRRRMRKRVSAILRRQQLHPPLKPIAPLAKRRADGRLVDYVRGASVLQAKKLPCGCLRGCGRSPRCR